MHKTIVRRKAGLLKARKRDENQKGLPSGSSSGGLTRPEKDSQTPNTC